MKKNLFSVLLFMTVVFFVACSDDNDKVALKYTLDITVEYPEDVEVSEVTDLVVKANNLQTSSQYTATIADGNMMCWLLARPENMP